MKRETPRDAGGVKLCAWCGEAIRQSGIGRSKDYCRRSCRQRAYEARKQREAIVAAVASAVVRRDSSRVETWRPDVPSRDESVRAGGTPVPGQAAPKVPSGDFLLAPPAESPQEQAEPVLPDAWRADPPAPRRKLSRNRSAMSAEAMPLWPTEEYGPEGANGG